MFRIYCLLIGYAFGLFQTSYILGKMHGIDIRDYGSGNAGTTNMMRTMGTKAGLITFAGDVAKTMIAVWLCYFIFRDRLPDMVPVIKIYAGAGAILGHNFPFYLNFKGGKGIACTAGLVLSYDPVISILGIITFFSIFFATHYVSLGSILVYVGLVTEFIVMGMNHWGCFRAASDAAVWESCVVMGLLAIMAFYKHRENIKRLLSGTEKKTYLKSKKSEG
ncbi:MAG: glycerol-3-phosphate 1-O-acyltransferase PlsY [Lachnospiraceae bacterium]|nr:glycerol-3-phosphate 1-O-acyltransferase PlsY [Lachnospiraceae bacterium]